MRGQIEDFKKKWSYIQNLPTILIISLNMFVYVYIYIHISSTWPNLVVTSVFLVSILHTTQI